MKKPIGEEIWTVELNLDDDFAYACAYHVDREKSTFLRNINHAVKGTETNRWAIVALAYSCDEAHEKAERLRMTLCHQYDRRPYGIDDLIDQDKEELKTLKWPKD